MSSISLRQSVLKLRSGVSLFKLVSFWLGLRRSRIALSRLDSHLMHDIGVTDVQARRESARPFWDM